jgi:hypothetical protein
VPGSGDRTEVRRFEGLTFEDFRELATDESLSPYERIGFPDSYREGAEEAIAQDIVAKLPALADRGRRFLDIGPGCSDLPRLLIDVCARNGHEAVLVDSAEMLAHLPDAPGLVKVPGRFPGSARLPEGSDGSFDAILAYSVLHYVFVDDNVFAFVDRGIELLAHGGTMLIGDVPNLSKRNRFFSSPSGVEFHKAFMETDEPPEVSHGHVVSEKIDDAVVLGLLARARAAGCDAYVVPLRPDLPLANRREDILIRKP